MNDQIRFEYVARNKKHGDIWREIYTLDEIIDGRKILTFFAKDNDNCEMLARRRDTGLSDKNGVEIYEYDIIQLQSAAGSFRARVVTYSGENMGFLFTVDGKIVPGFEAERMTGDRERRQIVDGRCQGIEVIGNIWEGPELLDGVPV